MAADKELSSNSIHTTSGFKAEMDRPMLKRQRTDLGPSPPACGVPVKPTSLQDLPLELREQIYHENLDGRSVYHRFTINLYARSCYPEDDSSSSATQPPLTRVNKQLRSETLWIFYAETTFYIPIVNEHSVRLALRWMDASKPSWQFMTFIEVHAIPGSNGQQTDYKDMLEEIRGPVVNDYTVYLKPKSKAIPFRTSESRPGWWPRWRVYERGTTGVMYPRDYIYIEAEREWCVPVTERVIAILAEKLNDVDMYMVHALSS